MIAKKVDGNTIEVYDLTQFDIDAIMHSGQVFRYFQKQDGGFRLVVGCNFAEIDSNEKSVIIKCNDADFFWNYFDLDTDYNKIKKELLSYVKLRPAIDAGGGIRILRSEFNEMVISFIISANNNIKRFTKTLNGLAEKYGKKLANGLYSFPSLEQLTDVMESDYKSLGCGYRSAYLVKAVMQLKSINIDELSKETSSEVSKILLKIMGVGKKVCSCILLFSNLHRLEICPIDTWIDKALGQLGEQDKAALLNHRYAGVAQQYIFYYLQHLHGNL